MFWNFIESWNLKRNRQTFDLGLSKVGLCRPAGRQYVSILISLDDHFLRKLNQLLVRSLPFETMHAQGRLLAEFQRGKNANVIHRVLFTETMTDHVNGLALIELYGFFFKLQIRKWFQNWYPCFRKNLIGFYDDLSISFNGSTGVPCPLIFIWKVGGNGPPPLQVNKKWLASTAS